MCDITKVPVIYDKWRAIIRVNAKMPIQEAQPPAAHHIPACPGHNPYPIHILPTLPQMPPPPSQEASRYSRKAVSRVCLCLRR